MAAVTMSRSPHNRHQPLSNSPRQELIVTVIPVRVHAECSIPNREDDKAAKLRRTYTAFPSMDAMHNGCYCCHHSSHSPHHHSADMLRSPFPSTMVHRFGQRGNGRVPWRPPPPTSRATHNRDKTCGSCGQCPPLDSDTFCCLWLVWVVLMDLWRWTGMVEPSLQSIRSHILHPTIVLIPQVQSLSPGHIVCPQDTLFVPGTNQFVPGTNPDVFPRARGE